MGLFTTGDLWATTASALPEACAHYNGKEGVMTTGWGFFFFFLFFFLFLFFF